MYSLLFLAASSLAICLILTPLCRDLFERFGWLDQPDQIRKTHARAVPRIGGIPIAIAYVGSFGLLLLSPLNAGSFVGQYLPLVWKLLPAAGLIFATGLIDDLVGLKSWQKLLGQIAGALSAYWGGVHALSVNGHPVASWWCLPMTVFWLVGCTNAFNLIDGVDGLAGGLGLFATVTTAIVALQHGNVPLALACAPLAGALLGFLRYNFNPASIFLGDSGSLLVGFLLGCYGVLWSQKSATMLGMAAPLMALSIPILDVCLSIARRFLRQRPIFGADRGHIHHRLLDRGLSPKRVSLLLYAVGGVGAFFAVLEGMVPVRLSILAPVLFCVSTWIFIRSLDYVEFGVVRKVLLGGGVRRLLGAHIHLENLGSSLAIASTPNDCWFAIRDACRHLGFHHVRLHLLGETYDERLEPGSQISWTIRVPVTEDDYVSCERGVGCLVETSGLATFADLLSSGLREKLATLRPSGSIDPQIAALMGHLGAAAGQGYGSPKVIMDAPAATAMYCLPSME